MGESVSESPHPENCAPCYYLFLSKARQALGVESPIVAAMEVSSLASIVNMKSIVTNVNIPYTPARRHGNRSRCLTSASNGKTVSDVIVTFTILFKVLTTVDLPMTTLIKAE